MHSPALNIDQDPLRVKCHIRTQCGWLGGWLDKRREMLITTRVEVVVEVNVGVELGQNSSY